MLMAPPGGLRVNYRHSYRKVTRVQAQDIQHVFYFPQNSFHEISSSHYHWWENWDSESRGYLPYWLLCSFYKHHYAAHLKQIQCYLLVIPQWKYRGKESEHRHLEVSTKKRAAGELGCSTTSWGHQGHPAMGELRNYSQLPRGPWSTTLAKARGTYSLPGQLCGGSY